MLHNRVYGRGGGGETARLLVTAPEDSTVVASKGSKTVNCTYQQVQTRNPDYRNLPSGYTQVESITASNNAYVDLGFQPTNKTRVRTKTDMPRSTSGTTYYLYGSRVSSSSKIFGFSSYSNNFRQGYNNSQTNFHSSDISGKYVVDQNQNSISLTKDEAVIATRTATSATYSTGYNAYLFAINNAGTASNFANCSADFVECYEDGTMIRDLVACVNSQNVAGYYDMENDQFYQAVQGTLTAGAVVPEYISGGYYYIGSLDEYGQWTVTATKGSDSKTEQVEVTETGDVYIELDYFKIWEIDIDQSNSDPELCCTYAKDAIGLAPADDEWDEIFGYKPCLFINGAVSKYLNPNNYAQDIDGNAVDITTLGNDVMVEFPKRGYKIETVGDVVKVSLTDMPQTKGEAQGFSYKPFSRDAIGDQDYFYIGAYGAYLSNDRVYSSSNRGKDGTSISTSINYCRNRGTNYSVVGWFQMIYLQVLYTLKYANLNSRVAVGYGDCSLGSYQTGRANTYGLNYGDKVNRNSPMKLFGIEDFYGHYSEYIGGIVLESTYYASNQYMIGVTTIDLPKHFDFLESGTSHTTYPNVFLRKRNELCNLAKVQGTNELGFFIKERNNYDTEFEQYYNYCANIDFESLDTSKLAYSFGGRGDDNWTNNASIFYFMIDNGSNYYRGGCRLMYV